MTEKNSDLIVRETFTNSAEYGVISQRDFFDHDITNSENIGGYYMVRDEDFVYNPRISATAPVGPVNRNKLGRTGVMSPLYTVFRTHDVNTTYLEWFFKSSYWHSFMYFNGDSGARSDRFSIKDAIFFEMPIPMPSIDEQYRIGMLMDKLDNFITLHQRKYQKLITVKKSMLEKMFPRDGSNNPEIRFIGFTDPWEQRKVKDVAPLQRGFDLPTSQMEKGPYPVVMSNGIGGYHSQYRAKGPGVVTGRSGTIGKLHYIEDDYWPHNTSLWVTNFNGNYPKFVYHLYQLLDLSHYGTGSGVPTLNRNDVHDAKVFIPSLDEQKQISKILDTIDSLITLHQRKFETIEDF